MDRINLTLIPQGTGPGTWRRVMVDEFTDHPRYTAIVTCPTCHRHLFAINHSIAEDGQISPSLGHPVEYPPCSWHESPKLLGWAPVPEITRRPLFHCAKCATTTYQLSGWSTYGGDKLICPSCLASQGS